MLNKLVLIALVFLFFCQSVLGEIEKNNKTSTQCTLAKDVGINYQSPWKEEIKRRREIGNSDTQSANRGMNRGINRGINRGFSRGISRGIGQNKASNPKLQALLGDIDQEADLPDLPESLIPIAPQHTGLTSHNQPTIYWYISGPWPQAIRFSLNKPRAMKPLVDTPIDSPTQEGIYVIDLNKLNIKLKPGIEYEWFITIILDEQERSSDLFASATIKYQPHKLPANCANQNNNVLAPVLNHLYLVLVVLAFLSPEMPPMSHY